MIPFPHEPNGCHVEISAAPESSLKASVIRAISSGGLIIGDVSVDRLRENCRTGIYARIYWIPHLGRVFVLNDPRTIGPQG